MSIVHTAASAGHVMLALAAVFLAVYLGRLLARLLRQPLVIGEITVGLIVGPAIVAASGTGTLNDVLPPEVLGWLRAVGHVGLVLFVVSVAHQLRLAPTPRGRRVIWTTLGALLVPLAAGGILAIWVLRHNDPALRGHSPAVSLTLLLAVGLSVTAVPVLARILADRGLVNDELGRLAITAAIFIDVVAWLLLAIAIGLSTDISSSLLGPRRSAGPIAARG